MIIFGILGIGMLAGWTAGWITRMNDRIDWGTRIIAGLSGSFVGGLLGSLIWGDGFALRPSGIVGSIVGAMIVLVVWQGLASDRT